MSTSPYEDPYDLDALRAEVINPGGRWQSIRIVAETGSTNADLVAAARAGAPDGTVLITDLQTAGRGRRGRTWTAPRGSSIMMSALVRPRPSVRSWSWCPLVTGLAVSDGLQAVGGVRPAVKWPNDVLVDGRKICGILLERVQTAAGPAAVIGIGVNVDLQEADLPVPTATSLAVLAPDRPHPRGPLVAGILAALDLWLGRWESDEPAEISRAYAARCDTIGREVEVHVAGQPSVRGRAERLDADGRLVVAVGAERQAFAAADVVHLR